MRALLLTIVIAIATPLAAESPKPATPQAAQERRPVLTLASNDVPHPGVADSVQHGQPPFNHRIARVTTCRCGDPQPDPESDSEQQ